MNANTSKILKFSLGFVGATICIISAVLVSLFAQQAAYIVDPILIAFSIQFLSLCANALGYRIGAAAALEKRQDTHNNEEAKHKPDNRKDEVASLSDNRRVMHLYHHFVNEPKKSNDSIITEKKNETSYKQDKSNTQTDHNTNAFFSKRMPKLFNIKAHKTPKP